MSKGYLDNNSTLHNPAKFDIIDKYFSCTSRESRQYESLVKEIGRHTHFVFPSDWNWFGIDIDRVELGAGCFFFGKWEFKCIPDSENVSNYEFKTRNAIKDILCKSDFQIEAITTNYTIPLCKGVKDLFPNVFIPSFNEIDWKSADTEKLKKSYNDYVNELRMCQLSAYEIKGKKFPPYAGKGVFIYLLYTRDLRYFSPINFTGSGVIFGKKEFIEARKRLRIPTSNNTWDYEETFKTIGKAYLQKFLEEVAKIIQPCFDEFLLYLLRCYIRRDFFSLYDCFCNRAKIIKSDKEVEKLAKEKPDAIFIDKRYKSFTKTWSALDTFQKDFLLWIAFSNAMEWILECIHFDTLLTSPDKYKKFVNLVRSGKITNKLVSIIKNEIKKGLEEARKKKSPST